MSEPPPRPSASHREREPGRDDRSLERVDTRTLASLRERRVVPDGSRRTSEPSIAMSMSATPHAGRSHPSRTPFWNARRSAEPSATLPAPTPRQTVGHFTPASVM